MRAIETKYNGYRFRSRLEARWAVFFDVAGIKYQYEPEGYEHDGFKYLPDFFLPEVSDEGMFFEVKGVRPDNEYMDKATRAVPAPLVLAVSDEPLDMSVLTREGHVWVFGAYFRPGDPVKIRTLSARVKPEQTLPKAAKAARQARFEHGETPGA